MACSHPLGDWEYRGAVSAIVHSSDRKEGEPIKQPVARSPEP